MPRRRKRLERTPNARILSVLRRLWLWSPERRNVLERDGHRCQHCGRGKADGAQLEVHHVDGIDWRVLVAWVRRWLLTAPDRLITLCSECHAAERGKAEEE